MQAGNAIEPGKASPAGEALKNAVNGVGADEDAAFGVDQSHALVEVRAGELGEALCEIGGRARDVVETIGAVHAAQALDLTAAIAAVVVEDEADGF